MKEIKNFVDEYFFEHHSSPSLQKIADGVGIGRTTVHRYIWDMDERGMLCYDEKTIETRRMRKSDYSLNRAPRSR